MVYNTLVLHAIIGLRIHLQFLKNITLNHYLPHIYQVVNGNAKRYEIEVTVT